MGKRNKDCATYHYRSFAGIPRAVMDHPDYLNLSYSGRSLLCELAYQFRSQNNGDLTVAWGVLNKRGFKSKETIRKATEELLDAGMIIRTRVGRFMNPGATCSLYALSWLPVNECPGKNLEVRPSRNFRNFALESSRLPSLESGLGSPQKLGRVRPRDGKGRFLSS